MSQLPNNLTVFAITDAFLSGTDTDIIAEILGWDGTYTDTVEDAIDAAYALHIITPGRMSNGCGWGTNW